MYRGNGAEETKKAQKLRDKLKDLGVSYDEICTDNWEAFVIVFQGDTHKIDKKYTTAIEGNNTLLRHRIRRVVFFQKVRKSLQNL